MGIVMMQHRGSQLPNYKGFMEIKNAKYLKDSEMIVCEIDSVKWWIPPDPANSDYAEIMRQVDAGELTIEPADE